jgi:hypothetical protein
MANDEHVALLKQGANAWNKWREANPDIQPDVQKADVIVTMDDATGTIYSAFLVEEVY